MTAADSTIVHRAGTYRTRTPEETWHRISPLLSTFRITRVADITLLDEIGFPVHVAYRPTGKTMAVSVGTGLTPAQSRVSAVMESIETWHAENLRLEIVERSPAGSLPLHYDVRTLNLAPNSPLSSTTVLDWVPGRGLLTGSSCLAPLDTIYLDSVRADSICAPSWAIALFRPTSNGMASGNCPAESTLHALFEIIERDCMTEHTERDPDLRVRAAPATTTNADTLGIVATLTGAGFWIDVYDITNDLGVPCYHARIWAPDLPMYCGGIGCHLDPGIALGRALLEAAQSRLVAISGARDDVDVDIYRSLDPLAKPPPEHDQLLVDVRAPVADPPTVDDAVRVCAEKIFQRTGVEPFVVDLTHPNIGISVSKVFAPGLALFDERKMADFR